MTKDLWFDSMLEEWDSKIWQEGMGRKGGEILIVVPPEIYEILLRGVYPERIVEIPECLGAAGKSDLGSSFFDAGRERRTSMPKEFVVDVRCVKFRIRADVPPSR